MNKKVLWFGCASFLAVILSTLPAISAEPSRTKPDQNTESGSPALDQQALAGTLEKVTDDTISLKTSDGNVKIFDISMEKKSQIKNMGLKNGDSAVVTLNQNKQIVAVTKLGGG